MTDAAPRAQTPFALIFALLGFVIAAGVAGLYIWDRRQKDQDQVTMIIDQLRRIDDRLSELEKKPDAPDLSGLNEKLDQLQLKLAETAPADSAVLNQQLQIIIEHQIKLQNDLAKIQQEHVQTVKDTTTAQNLKLQQQALLKDLQNLASTLITPPPSDNVWAKIANSWQRWVTVKPQASASADITTPTGKISRALYDLQQGDVESAVDVLPEDPRLASFRSRADAYLLEAAAQEKAAQQPSLIKTPETVPVVPLPQPPADEGDSE